ncbi:MAG: ADP-ribosyl-[dinitrogen reductase] hydrolase [Myxococcota bacterium]|jgi:ADP-ribosyl-[dinitrogen reductase] hydrolase
MLDNRATLARLLDDDSIAMRQGGTLDTPVSPLPASVRFDACAGMLLGVAIGDALGRPSEGMLPDRRRRSHGEVTDYHRHRRAGGGPAEGHPSDDTQLTFWTLDQLLTDGGLNPARLSDRFIASGKTIGEGQSVRAFRGNHQKHWSERGVGSAGNGALMRIAPILLPHLASPSPALWADAAIAGMLTHNDSASNAACVAFVKMLWSLLARDTPPPSGWWVETFCAAAAPLELADYAPRGGDFRSFCGPLSQWLTVRLADVHTDRRSTRDLCNTWHSGAYLLETLACVLAILERHAADPEQAIIRAVNDTKDNDTVAAVVGAAVGALHGRDALPSRWVTGLTGGLTQKGRGTVFTLIDRAEITFWRAP